jgi:hypothetical protein
VAPDLFNIIAEAQVREKDLTNQYVTRLNGLIKALPKDQVRSRSTGWSTLPS